MARKRAQQRWSALLARVAKQVRPALGDELWADFVAHAEARYKQAFVRAFRKPSLHCVGPPHGGGCPRAFCVDLTCASAYATLGALHLDHEQDLVCEMWVQALAPRPARHVGRRLSVTTRRTGRRCCVHGRHGARHCHNMPHYRGLRDVGLAPPVTPCVVACFRCVRG